MVFPCIWDCTFLHMGVLMAQYVGNQGERYTKPEKSSERR
jgi:hypothetical protein